MDASLAQDKVVRLTNGEEILLEVTTSDLVRDFKRKLLERLGKDSNKCAVDLAYNTDDFIDDNAAAIPLPSPISAVFRRFTVVAQQGLKDA